MELSPLTAISAIDGRYRRQVEHLDGYFSEFALIRYRVYVEIRYLVHLSQLKLFSVEPELLQTLEEIGKRFGLPDAQRIKQIEATTNHDVKAVEYFIKEELEKAGGATIKEWVHFGLTSQDINNTATPLLWKESMEKEYQPAIRELVDELNTLALSWAEVPMLARTHGQPASPTILGKEIMVFVERLLSQIGQLSLIPVTAKFGGATGNFNAHHVAYPSVNWIEFGNEFVKSLGLQRLQFTTQIEHYDNLAASCHCLARINTVLTDLCRDVWTYISLDYFTQKTKAGEVGSSAMPHKVNPIDFENAEGNLGLANALYEHLAAKLPISRLQRDLTDSTVLRNLGLPFAHTILAIKSIRKGLSKLVLNQQKINYDLDMNWAVVSEAIQTVLRRENYPNPYEALKDLTRGQGMITSDSLHQFIDTLNVSEEIKKELRSITPHNYTGVQPVYRNPTY